MSVAILGEILSLIGSFLQPDFTATAAARRLGLTQAAGPVGLTRLSPAGLAADYLVARREDLPGHAGCLTSLDFLWSAPPRLAVAELERQFGPGRLVLGTDNEDEDRFEIELRGHPLRGLLVVEFAAGGFGETLLPLRLRLVRILPPRFTPLDAAGETIILLDDLGALPDTGLRPFSATLGPLFGPDDLMALIEPIIGGTLANRIAPDQPPLAFEFRPRNLGHLDPAVAPRLLPALAPLYDLRDALRDLASGALKPRELRGRLDLGTLPPDLREATNRLIKEGTPTPTELRIDVEARVAAQGAEFLADGGFQRLARAWHHLGALHASLDAAAGQRLEVYPASARRLVEILRDGPVEEETYHPEGSPPLALVLGPVLADEVDGVLRRELVQWSDRMETPLWFDADVPFRAAPRAERPAAFVLPPLRKVVRRVETQFPANAPTAEIESAVTAALVARQPGARPTVRLARGPGGADRLTVTMELPVPSGAAPIFFRYDANWHDYR